MSAATCIRADNLMRGYWSAQGQKQGQSGLGLQDGCISIVGRSKDMVISGGEKIYPAEIENQRVTLPGVAESAVVGVVGVVGVAEERWEKVLKLQLQKLLTNP
ncbi:MAG: hypothetical protein ACK52H_01220 [Burkholderiales bacterium]|jgi:fatty-acyl-CoA synthase